MEVGGGRIEFGNQCPLMLNIDLTTLPITQCRAYQAQPYYIYQPFNKVVVVVVMTSQGITYKYTEFIFKK